MNRMSRIAPRAILMLLGTVAGCSERSASPGLPVPPSTSGATSATVSPAVGVARCVEGDAVCEGSGRAVCASGERLLSPCEASEVCLDGACRVRDDAKSLRKLGSVGYLNAWSVITPLAKKSVDDFLTSRDDTGLGGAKSAKAICARDGYVNPRRGRERRSSESSVSLLRGVIVAGKAREARLRVGVSGKLRIILGGKEIAAVEEARLTKKPLPDERTFAVSLVEGDNEIDLVLEEPEGATRSGGFYLRVVDERGALDRGLSFRERYDSARCSASALLDIGSQLRVDAKGLSLSVTPSILGLWPRDLPVELELRVGKERAKAGNLALTDPRRLASTSVAPAATTFPIPLPETGRVSFDLSAGEVVHEQTLAHSGAEITRLAKLYARYEAALVKTTIRRGSQDSLARHFESLVELIRRGDSDAGFWKRHVERFERFIVALEAGKDPYAEETGVVWRAYRSPLDGTLQPYVAVIPKSQLKGKPQPLVVVAHGRDRLPEHALRTLIGQAPDEHMSLRFAERNQPAYPDQGALLVAPYGFDEGGPHPLGEEDTLAVIDEMKKAYLVDAARVSLTGYSLGGTVAFVLPLRNPGSFSSAAPLCGYPNLMDYQSVRGVPRTPWEDALLAQKYIVNFAENGRHIPLHIVHGGKDVPGRSAVVADRYRELGQTRIFDVQEDLDHNVWDYAYEDGKMIPWLTRHKIPSSPSRVTLVTGDYRHDRAHWVRLVAMETSEGSTLARIDARFETDKIIVETKNVRAFSVDRAALGEGQSKALEAITLEVDGITLPVPAGREPIHLSRGAQWKLEPFEDPSAKRFGVSGPIDDIFRHPITIVYGTQVPGHEEANLMTARHWSHALGLAEIAYPIIADTDATEDALAGRSVIVVGLPQTNAYAARHLDALGLTLSEKAVTVRGKRFEAANLGITVIRPKPQDPSEYLLLVGGLTPEGTLASRFLPRYLPDYVVYDERVTMKRGDLLFGDRPTLGGGFFDPSWQ